MRLVLAALVALVALVSAACGTGVEISGLERPTATPLPTATPVPTPRPVVEPTPIPTPTPEATSTPVPTATPVPAPPTATPGGDVVPADLVIVEEGFYEEVGITTWWVLLVNDGPGIADNISVDVTARDADGGIVDTDSRFISYVLPGRATMATGFFFDATSPIVAVDSEGFFDDSQVDPADALVWDIASIDTEEDSFLVTTTFEASHTGTEAQEFVAFVTAYRLDGEVVAVTTAFETVPAGESVEVTADLFLATETLEWDIVEIFVSP